MAMTHLNPNDAELALIRALQEGPADGRQLVIRYAEGKLFVAMKEAQVLLRHAEPDQLSKMLGKP
jgi:hypothetical protein